MEIGGRGFVVVDRVCVNPDSLKIFKNGVGKEIDFGISKSSNLKEKLFLTIERLSSWIGRIRLLQGFL